MRINSINAQGILPLNHVQIEDMGDMVIISGANGSGKSRLRQAITTTFASPSSPQVNLEIGSTRRKEEEQKWGNPSLDVIAGTNNSDFTDYMQTRTRGGTYTGSLIQIDSNRALQAVSYQPLTLSIEEEESEYDRAYYLNNLSDRWQRVVDNIYRKEGRRRMKIADATVEGAKQGISAADIMKRFPDPIIPYKKATKKLLLTKELVNIDARTVQEFQFKDQNGTQFPFGSLSSGEQEVIKIVFDFLDREIKHCVVLIDEPELHLHPTLAFRLVETLRGLGAGTNQFIFFTHSGDLISTYFATGNVYFIDPTTTEGNQAHKLSDLVSNHSALVDVMGERLGLFAVGKKILFVEGEPSSIDKFVYHSLAQQHNSDITVLPVGSVGSFSNLSKLASEIQATIFGIKFYLLRDRDGLTNEQVKILKKEGILSLEKRHIENYLLDAELLYKVAQEFEITNVPELESPASIEKKLKEIASSIVNEALLLYAKEYFTLQNNIDTPSVSNVQSKSPTEMIDEYAATTIQVVSDHSAGFTAEKVKDDLNHYHTELVQSLKSDKWKSTFPGKRIFKDFISAYGLRDAYNRVTVKYMTIALKEKPDVFKDIIDKIKKM